MLFRSALATWGVIELMIRSPGLSEYIRDLEFRAEKAEAALNERREHAAYLQEALATARNDALEEAALRIDCNCNEMCMFERCPKQNVDTILALKETTNAK